VKGLAAIGAYGDEAWFGVYEMYHAITPEEIVQTGDSDALAWGTWTIDLKPKDGSAAQSLRGNFLDVLRKERDGWKFSRACFNIQE
jgi:ketosteroid isomerase-like protein